MRPNKKQTAVYAGLGLGLAGFVLIGLAWDGAAGWDCVECQFPYLLSGGLTGIGLVIVGTGILMIHTLRRDAAERDAQLQKLTATVESLAGRLAPADAYDPAVVGEYRPRPRAGTIANGSEPAGSTQTGGTWERA
jgi:hypothetical protein